MNAKEFISDVCKEIKYEPANKPIAEELKGHIEDIKSEYLCKGATEKEAEEKAVEQMGDAKIIGKKLNKMYGPKLDWKLLVLICIVMFFGILSAATHFKIISKYNDGNLISNIMFQKYIFVLGLGIILGGMIYFMDYKKISKYSLLIYLVGVFLNIISYISADARLEYLYASLPFYVISFAGFISTINQKKRNILKTIILAIISILLLRIMVWASETARFVASTYLIMSTIKILKLKKNRIKYLAIIWIVPIIFTCFYVYEAKIHYSELDYSNGQVNGRKELFHTAELFGTVKNPRRNSNDTTAYDFINSEYTFLSFLADYGWVVSIAMSLCVIALYIKLIINAIKIKDEYGKFIIISITAIYILQTVENFRKAFYPWGVISESRIPLVTFGITDLFVNIMCMALILSIYRGKNMIHEEEHGGVEFEN